VTTEPVVSELIPVPGDGCGEEGEGQPEMVLSRTAPPTYAPGGTVDITVRLDYTICPPLPIPILRETLPAGWSLAEIVEPGTLWLAPEAGATGDLHFHWMPETVPMFPIEFTYRVQVPLDQAGTATISGEVGYRVVDDTRFSNIMVSELNAPIIEDAHTGDQDANGVVNLTELLRLIQFFNIRAYCCAAAPDASEDGYLPGSGGEHACAPHSSDYAPQDWQINLTELLRLIQFFNMRGYHACPADGTEDGYCPGTG
jgi:hypothetical protein